MPPGQLDRLLSAAAARTSYPCCSSMILHRSRMDDSVLHNQHGLMPANHRSLRLFRFCLFGCPCVPGQVNPEGQSLAGFAVNIDEPLVLLDNAVNRGQPQPRAFPEDVLGGEKGSKSRF